MTYRLFFVSPENNGHNRRKWGEPRWAEKYRSRYIVLALWVVLYERHVHSPEYDSQRWIWKWERRAVLCSFAIGLSEFDELLDSVWGATSHVHTIDVWCPTPVSVLGPFEVQIQRRISTCSLYSRCWNPVKSTPWDFQVLMTGGNSWHNC